MADPPGPPARHRDGDSVRQPVQLTRHDLVYPDGRYAHVYGDAVVGSLDGLPADSGYSNDTLHRRFDRLTGAWVLVSPTRNVRPGGHVGGATDEDCPLCPGGGELVAPFRLAAFENRFPSMAARPVMPSLAQLGEVGGHELVAASVGRCEVLVYTAEHVVSLAELSNQQLAHVVAVLRDRTAALWEEGYDFVMAFENHGADVGATLDHMHGQIYAFDHVPPTVAVKVARHLAHRDAVGCCLGCTLIADDVAGGRVVHRNATFTAAVPFAPRWPLEVHIRARQHGVRRLADLDDVQARDLAEAIRGVVDRYRAMWGFELPYMMCVQEAPAGAATSESSASPLDDWHLHVEMIPPHRTARRLKVRASVETALGAFINDTIPEQVAARLAAFDVGSDWSRVHVPAIVPAMAPEPARSRRSMNLLRPE